VVRIRHDRNGDKVDLADLPLVGSKSIQRRPQINLRQAWVDPPS